MPQPLSASAQKVQEALRQHGLACEVLELPASARTAQDAAQAIGCDVAHIVKSLIFQGAHTQQGILALASGVNRVDEPTLSALVGEPLQKATAQFVRRTTGFAIGGVPPLGHVEALRTFIDADLLRYPVLWAAAGTPSAVFKLTPAELQAVTQGQVVALS